MKGKKTDEDAESFARLAGFWVLSTAIGAVVVVAWETIVYRLGGENLSTNHPLAMGVALFSVTLSERVLRKGVSESGWPDVAQSVAVGVGVGAILALL
jgi:hypothetical protein